MNRELDISRRILTGPKDHPGRRALRTVMTDFIVDGPHGKHQCLVYQPQWENLDQWRQTYMGMKQLPWPFLADVVDMVLHGLDYLHKECRVVHCGKFLSDTNFE